MPSDPATSDSLEGKIRSLKVSMGEKKAEREEKSLDEIEAALFVGQRHSSLRKLASSTDDTTVQSQRLLMEVAQQPTHVFKGHSHVVTSVDCDAVDGVCTGSYDGNIIRWDITTGEHLHTFPPKAGQQVITAVCCVGPFMLAADRDKKVRKFLLRTGQGIWTVDKVHTCSISCMGATDDIFATGSTDGHARIFNLETGAMLRAIKTGSSVTQVLLPSRGLSMFTGGEDGVIAKWDLVECQKQQEFCGHGKAITALATNGEWLWSGSKDCVARQWDLRDSNCVSLITGHEGPVAGIAVDGDRLFIAADVMVRERSISTGRPGVVLKGHSSNITSMRLSDEGTHLYTSSEDCTACHWVISGVRVA